MGKAIKCLNKGYVRLVDKMGDDLTVINAARVSFAKESYEMSERDERLINFLVREGHDSPFRHAVMQFEVYAPLFVTRQWEKYLIGSNNSEFGARNESSRRYITEKAEFYLPEKNEWRSAPENKKQGSGENLKELEGYGLTSALFKHYFESEQLYEEAIGMGVAPEQARLFLPAYGMYIRFRWTATLQTVCHMIKQRTASDAQYEFQEYAKVIKDIVLREFPISGRELLK